MSAMEGTIKAVKEKSAQLEAKLAAKHELDTSSSSNSHVQTSSPDIRIKTERFEATFGESWVSWIRKF